MRSNETLPQWLQDCLEPFGEDEIEEREGRGGMKLRYVKAHSVIQRLNEVFGGRWDTEVKIERTLLDDKGRPVETMCCLELMVVVDGVHITKTDFGTNPINWSTGAICEACGKPGKSTYRECYSCHAKPAVWVESPPEMTSLGDDVKGAISDALKRCARQLGIGQHLYEGHGQSDRKPAQSTYAKDVQTGRQLAEKQAEDPRANAESQILALMKAKNFTTGHRMQWQTKMDKALTLEELRDIYKAVRALPATED